MNGAGCGKEMNVFIPRGYGHKEITVKCGNTSPTGYPYQCEKCEMANADRNWRQEAMDNGEAWDEDDY